MPGRTGVGPQPIQNSQQENVPPTTASKHPNRWPPSARAQPTATAQRQPQPRECQRRHGGGQVGGAVQCVRAWQPAHRQVATCGVLVAA